MIKNEFWKRVAADVAIVVALALVGWFIYSYYQKTKELSAYKKQEMVEMAMQDSIANAETLEKEAIAARIDQFVKASAENRPKFLSRSTGNMAARWWKARYNSGYEIDESDMPLYYWFKSCRKVEVVDFSKDRAEVDVVVNVSSPWDKGRGKYTFMMVKEKDKWMIHNIIGDDQDLRAKYGY